MEWVKKNPVVVAGASVAVVLLGLAIWFLVAKMSASSEFGVALMGSRDVRSSLWQVKPYPSDENIGAIKKDQERVKKFMASLQTVIPQMPAPYNLDDRGLKILLEQTIADLHLAATNSKTAIVQANYSFGFQALRKKLTFKTNTYEIIALQLEDVKSLLGILFVAKINALEGIKRSSLTQDDDSGGADYLQLNPLTNQFSIITPYEIQFRCFGSELEAVVQGLVGASNCIVIKNINVGQSRNPPPSSEVIDILQQAAKSGSISIGAAQINAATKPVEAADRYAIPRFTPRGGGQVASALVDTNKPVTVLSERPLRVTVLLDIVRTLRPSK